MYLCLTPCNAEPTDGFSQLFYSEMMPLETLHLCTITYTRSMRVSLWQPKKHSREFYSSPRIQHPLITEWNVLLTTV
jgi:hypothetical protein